MEETIKLAAEQQEAFNQIEKTLHNVAILGKPGVGKSVLIRALVDKGQKRYTLAAPTGLAALNIGGKTLHSIFRLPISQGIIEPDYNVFPNDDRVIKNIKYNVNHLIIDEVSMVRADMFDYIDRLMRFCKESTEPFGGAQVILVGDFYQLPPVVVREENIQLKNAGYDSPFAFSSKAFMGNFKIHYLNEVHRQKGDTAFIDFLNIARTGDVRMNDIGKLNMKVTREPKDVRIQLTGTNKQSEIINYTELSKIEAEPHVFRAEYFGSWPAFPVEVELTLKVGAQVMVKKNGADLTDDEMGTPMRKKKESKVVNGTLGVVVDFIPMQNNKPEAVRIRLDNGEEVNIYRRYWERKVKEKVDNEWTERVLASFEQMPLSLAWAISMHKSQGQSFEKVHIDPTKIFAAGQMYVALSRARSSAGVTLHTPLTPNKFWTDMEVKRFYIDLEEAEEVEPVKTKGRVKKQRTKK